MLGEDEDISGPESTRTDAFQRLQSTISSTQRARPPLMEYPAESEEVRVPLKPAKLNRRQSRGGLRGIFSRNKVAKNAVLSDLEEPSAVAPAESPVRAVTEKNPSRSASLERVATLTAPKPAAPSTPKPASKASQMKLSSKSIKRGKTVPKPSPNSATKSSPKPPTRTSAAWDPPPLFQAYPQAIKHAALVASTLSADSILRISNHKRNNSLREEIAQNRSNGEIREQTIAAKKAQKAKSRHRRQVSGSISKADWTQKIFVLVTSGYLLQYAGEGSFDRLPEKMMQLGKDSVAFASDVIPGKHWVLQISQSIDADGTPTADSRSLLSRLTFRGADYRRTATSLLLVLNSAEDMDSWIATVRREIEGLGGKKHVSETGKPKADEEVMQLKAQPSHRYLAQRDSDQFSNPASPTSPTFNPTAWVRDEEMQDKLDDAALALTRPLSTIRPSTGHQSLANSVLSHDGRQLESLRGSAHRLSYMSSGQRTLITSHCSSTTSSPTRDSPPSSEDIPRASSTDDVCMRPNAAAINERRRSIQTMQIPVLDAAPPSKNYRHSTFGSVPARPHQSYSPPTLNFSTPRRYSSSRILVPEVPAIPAIITTTPTPNKSHDTTLRGTRKGPPVALNLNRPLSTVEDSDSTKKRPPLVFTPSESSFKMVQQLKPSVVDIPPRSPNAISQPTHLLDLPKRMSHLTPPISTEIAHLDFQFPKLFSSMHDLTDRFEPPQEEPLRPAPLAPMASTTPVPVSSQTLEQEEFKHYPSEASEQGNLSPLPAIANTEKKKRRPTSMQIRPQSSASTRSSTPSASPVLISPSRPSSRASTTNQTPSFQRVKVHAHPKAVGNRKSMPALMNGPPPAPPPDCALPPLPPSNSGMGSPMGVRTSVVRV